MDTVRHALRISERYPVFPCALNKRPTIPTPKGQKDSGGFKHATQDAERIVEMWREYPGPLIGVPTGAVSGFDVLDVDPKNNGDAWLREAVDSLPVTRTHHTRSGGRHLFFAHAEGVRNTAGRIGPGVDTRGDGGFIIWWAASGCAVENADVIAPWPRWLLKLTLPASPRRAPPTVPATLAEADTRAQIMISRAFDRVRHAAPGQRHYQLRAAAATLAGLERFLSRDVSDTLVELAMSAGGEDRENAKRTVAWAMSKGRASPLLASRHV